MTLSDWYYSISIRYLTQLINITLYIIIYINMKKPLFQAFFIYTFEVKWYRYSGHLEKCVIGMKLLEVKNDNEEKELFESI